MPPTATRRGEGLADGFQGAPGTLRGHGRRDCTGDGQRAGCGESRGDGGEWRVAGESNTGCEAGRIGACRRRRRPIRQLGLPQPRRPLSRQTGLDREPGWDVSGIGSIHGTTFVDDNANGQLSDAKQRMTNVELVLTFANGLSRTTHSDGAGEFRFEGLQPGLYHLAITPTGRLRGDHRCRHGRRASPMARTRPISPSASSLGKRTVCRQMALAYAASDDEQIVALASVTSLPLRFAEGRDLMAQVQRRALGDGLIWLGVPFRSQLDGGDFQYVNCGPASLTMVLAGFGLDVGPSQVRDYLNNLIDNYNADLGTSLDVLSRIATQAGLTPMDLYSDQGGYRNWSTDAVRWHVQQGHPVITLVKYRNLPGHTQLAIRLRPLHRDHRADAERVHLQRRGVRDDARVRARDFGCRAGVRVGKLVDSAPRGGHGAGAGPEVLDVPGAAQEATRSAAGGGRAGARRLAEADAGAVARAPLVLTPGWLSLLSCFAGPLALIGGWLGGGPVDRRVAADEPARDGAEWSPPSSRRSRRRPGWGGGAQAASAQAGCCGAFSH